MAYKVPVETQYGDVIISSEKLESIAVVTNTLAEHTKLGAGLVFSVITNIILFIVLVAK